MSEATNKQGGFIVGAAFMMVLVAAFVVVLVFGQGGKEKQTTPADSPSAVPSDQVPMDWSDDADSDASESDGACDLEPVEDSALEAGFVDRWIDIDTGIRVPTAMEQGPKFTAEVPHCFAHSQMGAVLAAGNWLVLGTSGYEGAKVYEQYLFPDAMGQAAIEQMRLHGVSLGSPVELRGWIVDEINDETTVVHVAYSLVNQPSVISSMPVTLKWREDWKVVFPENGEFNIRSVRSLDLDGYKRW